MKIKASLLPVSRGTCVVLLLCALSGTAFAQDSAAPQSNPASGLQAASAGQAVAAPTPEPVGGAAEFPVLRTAGGFALVISLILIAFLVARKVAPQYFNRRESQRNLKVIESLSVGEKRTVALIQVGERRFLIGNTPHQITLLSQLEDEFPLLAAPEKPGPGESAPQKPTHLFRRFYETEKNRSILGLGKEKTMPPDVRAKMRQLREALEG